MFGGAVCSGQLAVRRQVVPAVEVAKAGWPRQIVLRRVLLGVRYSSLIPVLIVPGLGIGAARFVCEVGVVLTLLVIRFVHPSTTHPSSSRASTFAYTVILDSPG